MTTTIPGLTGQTTTEDADLIVLQNTAANRTRHITVANFRSELAADMDIVTTAELNLAMVNVTAAYQAADNALKELLFPVGTKVSVSSGVLATTNPSVAWGFGTWVKEEGKYYVGHKTGDTNFGAIGASIGAVNHSHTGVTGSTTLNTSQIPSHSHSYKDTYLTEASGSQNPTFDEYYEARGYTGIGTDGSDYDNSYFLYKNRNTASVGDTNGHTHTITQDQHLPPTIVEVVWRRTA